MSVDPLLTNWLQVGTDPALVQSWFDEPEPIPEEPYRYEPGVWPPDDDCGAYYARQLPCLTVTRQGDVTGPAYLFLFWHGRVLMATVRVRDLECHAWRNVGHLFGLMTTIADRMDPPHLVDWFRPLFAEAWAEHLRACAI